MSTELIPILALAVMFIAATVLPVNMGALGFVAAFIVGTVFVGMSTDDIIGGFPSELFLTLVGVTYLFAIAQNNGTVDLMVRGAVRLVRGRVALIPWVMFGITGLLTAVGALGPAAVAIIAPIALGFAARYKINALLMGMMVIHGAQAGGFSPISVYGVTVNTITADAGLVDSPLALFLGSLLFNAAIGVLLFVFPRWQVADRATRRRPSPRRCRTPMGPVRLVQGRTGRLAAARSWRRRAGARPRPSRGCRPQ